MTKVTNVCLVCKDRGFLYLTYSRSVRAMVSCNHCKKGRDRRRKLEKLEAEIKALEAERRMVLDG